MPQSHPPPFQQPTPPASAPTTTFHPFPPPTPLETYAEIDFDLNAEDDCDSFCSCAHPRPAPDGSFESAWKALQGLVKPFKKVF